ncbi:sensor histidine kinase [Pseudonocardia oroxyli]|uniref:histidine kinase n=1 Tax=Pseudonocardia oroxyli TaxID=366584 RepID=A0A1G7Z6N5_PSEOR|nr:HAMP domain-containing sensor histidine kinase [Pseudonocardia oroxyli]SDH04265.1 two-component system, OmpR family, sensor kinase [Pseudonocardia oroxyli]
MATGVTSAVGRLRRARFTSRMGIDVGALVVLCTGVVVLASSQRILDWVHEEFVVDLLTLVAAGVGAATAILALIGSRVLGEARLAWLAAALVLYCVVVLPWTALGTAESTAARVSRMLAYATALVLLVFALRAPRRMGAWGGWLIMLVGGGASLLALFVVPDLGPFTEVLTGPVYTTVLVIGWAAAAVLGVVDAARRQSGPRLRAGLGLVVLAGAQLYRTANGARVPATDLVFPALRLVGLVVVLVGLLQIVGRGVRRLQEENFVQQEELAVAALHMERAAAHTAERNHELRNGLAGLAGITHLLSAEVDGPDQERLRGAVLAELGRLHTILESTTDPERLAALAGATDAEDYLVEPMLAGLVELQRAQGRDVRLEVPDGLHARGDSAVVAQIVTNLLTNCERHAAGTPVLVRAFSEQDTVVIEVRDHGPGLPPGREGIVLVRGVHDPRAGGSGLGLHISRELAEGQGGSLSLRTVEDPRGCAARLSIPAVDAERPAADAIAP